MSDIQTVTPVTGRDERFRPDQLVVDLPHLDLVMTELGELGAGAEAPQTDDRLELALIQLADVGGAADRLRERATEIVRDRLDRRLAEAAAGRSDEVPAIDRLLIGLRLWFAADNDGWVPTMGKNRVIEPVKGFPHLGFGGEGEPQWVAGGFPRPELQVPDNGRRVRVGILDTGLFPHPMLAGGYVAGADTLLEGSWDDWNPPVAPWVGHATFIAGIVLGRAPAAQLDVRRVLDDENGTGDVWSAARSIAQAGESGVDVLNLSFGCFTDDREAPLVLERAVAALGPDTVVVAAAGNHGDVDSRRAEAAGLSGDDPEALAEFLATITPRTPMWPAALDGVVSVGAADGDGKPASFSPDARWVDVLAPGVDLISSFLDAEVETRSFNASGYARRAQRFNGLARWSGTSFAAAVVSGSIAARTEPGGRTAREAYEELVAEAGRSAPGGPPILGA
jgi:subtilisin family serine protease